jgi:hypothetical protein
VQLDCGDCHRPANVAAPWRFGKSQPQLLLAGAKSTEPAGRHPKPSDDLGGAFMAPVLYEQSCVSCHNLQFDTRFAESAPHAKPQEVREFLLATFNEYIRKNPREIARPTQPMRRLPGRSPEVQPQPRTASAWVQQSVAAAEELLYQKSCKQCHQVDFKGGQGALPQVAESNVPSRWMPHAAFDHRPHRMLDCDSCHQASASKASTDVLMPAVANCQTCHRADDAAESGCFECHQYHRWAEEKRVRGRFRIEDLVSGRPPAAKSSPTGN